MITILIAIAVGIAVPFILALVIRKNYFVKAELIIDAPCEKVFNYVKQLKNQDHFNKWVMVDPNMKREFRGIDGQIGFIYAWNGNKQAGEGELEIKALEEGKLIQTEIRFVRPMPGIGKIIMITEAVSESQTKVSWSNESTMKYPLNLLVRMIEKMLTKDMHTSLNNLKTILEKKD